MKAVLRRSEPQDRRESLTLADVVLDRESHDVTVAGSPVELTAKEFDLLAFFMANTGIVVSRDLLLDRVWGVEYPGGTRTVDVHVAQLRRKLGRPDLIRTLRGSGLQGRLVVKTLRGRLFGVTLAALALDAHAHDRHRGDAHPPPGRQGAGGGARPRAPTTWRPQRRRNVSYQNQNRMSANVRVIVDTRPRLAAYVPRREPRLERADDVPRQGLPLLVPDAAAPRPADAAVAELRRLAAVSSATCCSRALAGVGLAAILSFLVARSIVRPIRRDRRRHACARRRRAPRAAAARGHRRARRRWHEAFNEMTEQLARLARGRAQLPAVGQPRAEDAADGDPRLRRGSRRGRVRRRRGRADDQCRSAAASSGSSATCSTSPG